MSVALKSSVHPPLGAVNFIRPAPIFVSSGHALLEAHPGRSLADTHSFHRARPASHARPGSPRPGARAREVQVYATFLKDGTYRIDIPVDEEHLAAKDAGPSGGETRYGPIQGMTPEVDQLYGRFFRSLVDGATISFDGRPVRPELAIAPPDPDAPPGRVTLRLHGPIPGGARTFTWSGRAGARLLSAHPPEPRGTRAPSGNGWKGAPRASPSPLAAAVIPPTRWEVIRQYLKLGFTHILPKGPDHILFVLGIFLLSRRLKPLLHAGDLLHHRPHA